MAINTITISGHLVAEPELRYTQSGSAVANGRIAVDDGYGNSKKTYFFDYTAWTNTAEYIAKYATKGTLVTMQGKLTQHTWQTPSGENRSKVEILAQEVVLPPKANEPSTTLGEEITFDDQDLPF